MTALVIQPATSLPMRRLFAKSVTRIRLGALSHGTPRYLHNTVPTPATPLPNHSAPGRPPEPPKPAVSTAGDRIARKRQQVQFFQADRVAKAKKRFWRDVHLKQTPDGRQILLDSRFVRNASRNILTIPDTKQRLAVAIALEWDLLTTTQQALKQHCIPLTSLASRAMDIQADRQGVRDGIVGMLINYLATDTLLCWAPDTTAHDVTGRSDGVETLQQIQARTAQPIINFLTTRLWPGVDIRSILEPDSILPRPQSLNTVGVIEGWLSNLPAWELAGIERAVLASKSLLVAVRLVAEWSPEFARVRSHEAGGRRFGIEEAATASSLEVSWQTGMWGEVEDTHDVDKEDLRRQLGSVVLLVNG